MKKSVTIVIVLIVMAALALGMHFYRQASLQDRLIAVSWGDGKYGKALYGAYVFFEKQDGQLAVKLTVHIGRGTSLNNYRHGKRRNRCGRKMG